MAYNYEYPYDNPSQANADWIITTVKNLAIEWAQVQKDWTTQQEAFESLKKYITDYFANLNLDEEISEKIDRMYNDGSLLPLLKPDVISTTNEWLKQHITTGNYPIDSSLTLNNSASESSVVGSNVRSLSEGNFIADNSLLTISDLYLTASGGTMENKNFKVSDFIPIKSVLYDSLSISTDSDMTAGAHFCLYDVNKDFIKNYYVELNIRHVIAIPLNTFYIRICSRNGKSIVIHGVDTYRRNNKMLPYENVVVENRNGLYLLNEFFDNGFNTYYKWKDCDFNIREITGKMLLSSSGFNSFRIGLLYSDGFQGYIIISTRAIEIYTKDLTSIANTKIDISFGLHDYRVVLSERCFLIYIDDVLTGFLYSNVIGRELIRTGFQYRGNMENNTAGTIMDVKKSRSYIHFSFDDVINVFEDLTKNAGHYNSIFDNPFFSKLKVLHELYGAVFSLYCFQVSGTFNLDNTTTKFKGEFHNNSDWLKIGYHAYDAGTYESETPVDTLINRVRSMKNAIIGFSSINNYDPIPRFGFFNITKEQTIALRNNNLILGTLTADDRRDMNVGLTDLELTTIRTAFEMRDYVNDIQYVKTLPRYDSDDNTTKALENVINSYDNLAIECFAHSLSDVIYERIDNLYAMTTRHNIKPGYYNSAH